MPWQIQIISIIKNTLYIYKKSCAIACFTFLIAGILYERIWHRADNNNEHQTYTIALQATHLLINNPIFQYNLNSLKLSCLALIFLSISDVSISLIWNHIASPYMFIMKYYKALDLFFNMQITTNSNYAVKCFHNMQQTCLNARCQEMTDNLNCHVNLHDCHVHL